MNCDEFEQSIFEFIDGALTPASAAALEAHVRGCPGCRETARQAQRLDVSLANTLTAPVLPADFQSRLQERIRVETISLTAEERAERKRRAEEEYAAGVARLKHRWVSLGALAEWLIFTALLASAGWLGWHWIGNWLIQPAGLDFGFLNNQLWTPALTGALFFAAALLAGCPPARRKLAQYLT